MDPASVKRLRVQIERDLKKNDRSLTRQRRVIIGEILRSGAHFDIESLADGIRAANPSIGHATVYRTVKLLAEQGLIKKRMLGETHSHYEIVRHDHGHFVCTSCGRIIELGCPTLDDFLEAASKKHKFTVHRHSVELFGMCGQCRIKSRAGA
ncbi:MAG: transcriptional repressor [Chitinispirillaceae bacterium]|nr:transcriptional repressor [Chitinispirillaceae bacterium]